MTRKLASTHLTLPPVARGALMLLADLETAGARSDMSPPAVRLIRQELDRVLPGGWESATVHDAAADDGADPKDRAEAVYEHLSGMLATLVRSGACPKCNAQRVNGVCSFCAAGLNPDAWAKEARR